VNCEVCGTELPHGAMFCGECGRAVTSRTAQAVHPDSGMPVEVSSAHGVATGARDTVILEPLTASLPEFESEFGEVQDAAVVPEQAAPEPASVVAAAADEESTDIESAEAESADVEQDLPPEVVAEELAQAEPKRPRGASSKKTAEAASVIPAPTRPNPFPWGDRGSAVFTDSDEIEQTLIIPRRETGQRFVLQFSTGESVTVYGSGLLGRNPAPQPSEYFDQLVSISDPGKSVSKTHIEFGQDAGSFWVSDRFSGNGSVVREPESSPRRLVPGKRYRVVRGTRVDIGEQFFVVS
jgi:hypothetical protein